jgi:hypothetical protein
MTMDIYSPEVRQKLLEAYWASQLKTDWPGRESLDETQLKREFNRQDRLLAEYAEWLPSVPVSRCPLCQEVMEYRFDPLGLDGIWWSKADIVVYPQPDNPHFGVMMGAIDFHDREATESASNGLVLPGPGVPFVVPRLLNELGMTAVLSQIDLPLGDTAYTIAYFAEEPLDSEMIHQPWARESVSIVDEEGEVVGWGAMNDIWDFDLQPWIEKGSIQWIVPGDETLTLVSAGDCPFVGLPGVPLPQLIRVGEMLTTDLPDGEALYPFE